MARHPLGRMDPPPPGPVTMVPSALTTGPRRRDHPGQLAKCGCRTRAWGLTSTYNRVRDPDCHDPAIRQLREIHEQIDEAVLRAYGWDDLDLKIGHHPTKIGLRWTVGKEARFELLDRLLEENHRRYAKEQS